MELEIFQIDAFTDHVFGGNPAAVIILDEALPDELMQKIAQENNLSETVFVLRVGTVNSIRWFTPQLEVDLCGHATLAAAEVLFKQAYMVGDCVYFESNSGQLSVKKSGELLSLNFPSRPATASKLDPACLEAALGIKPIEVLQARDTLAVFSSQAIVESIKPDFTLLASLDTFGVAVTAPGRDCDFVSRFFAPAAGVQEDPVTGSAHCTLAPYWANRLKKESLHARQISKRGGEVFCHISGDRVIISGYAVEYLRGRITL